MRIGKKEMVVVIASMALGLMGNSEARSLAEIKNSGKLIIGTASEDFPPFYFMKDGKLTGWEYDYGNEIAKRMGLTPVWKRVPLASISKRLYADEFDVAIASLGGFRGEKFDNSSISEYCSSYVDISSIKKPVKDENYKDAVVGVLYGEEDYYRKISKGINSFVSEEEAVKNILLGRTDVYPWLDKAVAKFYVRKYPNTLSISVSEDQKKEISPAAINVKKSATSDNFIKEIEAIQKKILSDGAFEKITARYIDENIRCRSDYFLKRSK